MVKFFDQRVNRVLLLVIQVMKVVLDGIVISLFSFTDGLYSGQGCLLPDRHLHFFSEVNHSLVFMRLGERRWFREGCYEGVRLGDLVPSVVDAKFIQVQTGLADLGVVERSGLNRVEHKEYKY